MLVLTGIVILVLLCVDVFVTVFNAVGRGGPLNRLVMRGLWRFFRIIGVRKDGPPRKGVLALAGPVIVLTTLAVWITLLVAGFALIYYRWIGSFLISPGELRMHWAEALYYSGYTAATLGFGDLVPDHEWLRLLAPVEAFGGFALLSVSITYVLAIYRELVSTQQLASNIAGYLRAVDPVGQEDRHGDAIARWMEGVNDELLHALNSHYTYPLLHYFRPADDDRALPPQLAKLDDLRMKLNSSGHPLAGHPSLLALSDSLDEYLAMIDRLFVPGPMHREDGGTGGRDPRIGALLEHMGYSD